MSTTAQYATTPTIDQVQISTANTNRDGTGSLGTVASGPSSAVAAGVGKRIQKLTITATGTTTAGCIRFFLSTDGGTTKRMIYEHVVTAVTVGASTAAFTASPTFFEGFILQGQVSSQSCILYASTHNSETFNIHVMGATF